MAHDFYHAFEDKYRGSYESIQNRLEFYTPFVKPLLSISTTPPQALDLGCGRGEWLELLSQMGFLAQGVDIDRSMLASCRARGLSVIEHDGLAYLKGVPSASLALISAFHLVEHIPFKSLQELMDEALRALMPGGILILETPNPENLIVSTRHFYLDPTHKRPIPPLLLSFLAEYTGFEKTKVIRLQEPKGLSHQKVVTLRDALEGTSPDYSIYAQKKGGEKIEAALANIFSQEYGLTLEYLLHRFETSIDLKIQIAENKAQVAENRATAIEVALAAIHNSRSWKITAPLRSIANMKQTLKRVNLRAWLKNKIIKPILRTLRASSSKENNDIHREIQNVKQLPEQAQSIYSQLQLAIKQKSKDS